MLKRIELKKSKKQSNRKRVQKEISQHVFIKKRQLKKIKKKQSEKKEMKQNETNKKNR